MSAQRRLFNQGNQRNSADNVTALQIYAARTDCDGEEVIDADLVGWPRTRTPRMSAEANFTSPAPPSTEMGLFRPPRRNVVQFPPSGHRDQSDDFPRWNHPSNDPFGYDYFDEFMRNPSSHSAMTGPINPGENYFQIRKHDGSVIFELSDDLCDTLRRAFHISKRVLLVLLVVLILWLTGELPDAVDIGLSILF